MKRKTGTQILYDKLLELFPSVADLKLGEGMLLKLSNRKEVHLNRQAESAILAFYRKQGKNLAEEVSYEIQLDHVNKQLQAEVIRHEDEKSLFSRLSLASRTGLKTREGVSMSGEGEISKALYRQICVVMPVFDEATVGNEYPAVTFKSRRQEPPKMYVMNKSELNATVEFSGIGVDGIGKMTVCLDMEKNTASVIAISGAFGRYPSYLPYPDGKEMMPHERGKYSRMLNAWLKNKSWPTMQTKDKASTNLRFG
jgi:hypothetical protein